jgi:hypothetical protein
LLSIAKLEKLWKILNLSCIIISMKSKIRKRTWRAIYRLLDRVSPVDYDCGKLCNAACCTYCGDLQEEDLGIYLYPGEEKLHRKEADESQDWLKWSVEKAEDFDFPDSWSGNIYFGHCKTPPICPRELRPLQCRTYPLTPHLDENGVLSLIYNDEDLPYSCPLIEDEIPLNDDFVKATYTVWKHLLRDPLIYDLVAMDSKERRNAY